MTKSAKSLAKHKVSKTVERKPKKVVSDEQREADRQRNIERLFVDFRDEHRLAGLEWRKD